MQELIVALIVFAAFWAAAKRYAPKSLKTAFTKLTIQVAKSLGFSEWANKVATAKATASCGDGCGSCGGNGASSCGPTPHNITTGKKIIPIQDGMKSSRSSHK